MSKFQHSLGNKKINFLKSLSFIFSKLALDFIGLFFKLDKKKSEIIISSSFHAPWKEDLEFLNFYTKIKDDTLLDVKRLYTLWYLSKSLKSVNASILDIGCCKGGSGFALSKANAKGFTFLIDTFAGPKIKENLISKDHYIFDDVNYVKEKIKFLKLQNTKVIKTFFPKKLTPKFKKKKIKLCHIDVNTTKATKLAFEYVKKRIIKNGIIIFDDYGIYSVDSVKNYVDYIKIKFAKEFIFINNYMGQCIFIKK
tara:strand:- start:3036 stop:3794 length:759 start_codon:yes stop_codon:yes gene_type:complete